MNADKINKQYWSTVDPGDILAGLCFPEEELIKLLPKESKVLDVGCGTGKISEYLSGQGYSVTGIDINKKALEENKTRNPNIEYLEADITNRLPFADSFFDAITVPYVFVSIIDTRQAQKAAAELIRVLKIGGLLWLCEATYSKDYDERYKLGKEITGLNSVALSFFEDTQGRRKVKRVIRHYSNEEIDLLFKSLNKISNKLVTVTSPSSGMAVQTIITVYKKI